jgi:hypothetical protein
VMWKAKRTSPLACTSSDDATGGPPVTRLVAADSVVRDRGPQASELAALRARATTESSAARGDMRGTFSVTVVRVWKKDDRGDAAKH